MDTTSDIVALYTKLPPEIKSALSSIELADSVEKIAQDHKLHIDQEGFLWDSIKRVMVGLTKASAFTNEIKEGLKISDAEAVAITKDAQQTIFLPIRELLKEVGGETFTETAPEDVRPFNANTIIENPERERVAVLDAITNPAATKSAPSSYVPPVTQTPKAPEPAITPNFIPPTPEATTLNPVATPVMPTNPSPDNLVAAKLSGGVSLPPKETTLTTPPSKPGTFSDLKAKINADPYKEPI